MKYLILLILLLSVPAFAGWNPKWVKVTPSTNMVVKGSNVEVVLTATFQTDINGQYSNVEFSLAGKDSLPIAASALGTASWSINITDQPAAHYYATATIGTAVLNTLPEQRRVTVVDVEVDEINNIEYGELASCFVNIIPNDLVDPVPVTLNLQRISGLAGLAEFEDGTVTKTILESGTIFIRGTEVSDPDELNIMLSAGIGIYLCDAKTTKVVDNCAIKFAGVTFDLTDQINNPLKGWNELNAFIKADVKMSVKAQQFFFDLKLSKPAVYTPKVTIQTPNDDNNKAKEFRVGLAQSYIGSTTEYIYDVGPTNPEVNKVTRFETTKVPCKDGASKKTTLVHDRLYTSTTQVSPFTGDNNTVQLTLNDKPEYSSYMQLYLNPDFRGAFNNNLITQVKILNKFRTWVVAEHIESKCFKQLHYIDWQVDALINITYDAQGNHFAIVRNDIIVTVPNGVLDGKNLIHSNVVANDIVTHGYK